MDDDVPFDEDSTFAQLRQREDELRRVPRCTALRVAAAAGRRPGAGALYWQETGGVQGARRAFILLTRTPPARPVLCAATRAGS